MSDEANQAGKLLDELDFDGALAHVLTQYALVARTGVPQFDFDEFVNDQGSDLHYQRLLLSRHGQYDKIRNLKYRTTPYADRPHRGGGVV